MDPFLLPVLDYGSSEDEPAADAEHKRGGAVEADPSPTQPRRLPTASASTVTTHMATAAGAEEVGAGDAVSSIQGAVTAAACPASVGDGAEATVSGQAPARQQLDAATVVAGGRTAARPVVAPQKVAAGRVRQPQPLAGTAASPGVEPLPEGSGSDASDDDGHADAGASFDQHRRRAVFTAMLILLEKGASSEDDLCRLLAPMSGEELEQTAEERALAGGGMGRVEHWVSACVF